MRTSDAALAMLALISGCSPSARQESDGAPQSSSSAAATSDAYRIACAHGHAPLTVACTVEVDRDVRGTILILRFPDGAFRRLLIDASGRGVVAADGAVPALVTVEDGSTEAKRGGGVTIDVAVGSDRFRLPAHLRSSGASSPP